MTTAAPEIGGLPAGAATAANLHELLLEHFKRPHNRRELADPSAKGEGRNPLCGDQIKVALAISNGSVCDASFQGRGCSVCIASASLMTDYIRNLAIQDVRAFCARLRRWAEGEEPTWNVPPMLAPLELVRTHSIRRRCMSLAWEALADALR